jgi:hypothetical protein
MKEEKDKDPDKEDINKASEPQAAYGKRNIRFYNSFEEQAEEEYIYMASLSPIERLKEMRRFINIAYGMHGYDPENLPKKHTIKFISYEDKTL